MSHAKIKPPFLNSHFLFSNSFRRVAAAEYVHEVGAGRMVAIEAVVVSDVPGSVGQASDGVAGGPGAEGAAKGGAGRAYGWGRAARCALLMATATFLEEIIGLG